MKHSELNTNQNNFGIQISSREINNKSFSIAEQGISASNQNSNTLMINSVIPTHININSSAILSSTLNNQRSINLPDGKNYNLAILAKPNNSSSTSISSNLVSPLNTIKLVNLSKCQQISNINKDNNNVVQNNTINVQFVSNTSNAGCSDSISLQPSCKIDSITLNNSSMTTTVSNPSISTNSTLGGTRFVIQGASPQFLHQGTVTFIPQSSDMINNSISNNHIIKNPKFVFTGNKQHQTIRPITTTGSASFVVSQSNVSKQPPISIISPSKSANNIGSVSTMNVASTDVPNQTVLTDQSVNHSIPISSSDSKRCLKSTQHMKIPLQSYSVSTNSNNNIRLALTSNINNSRVNAIQSKIQLISPKSRKRSGSPALPDGKIKNPLIGSKDENIDNSINYNNQLGNYSPTRKRARKQHLKAVNTKSQKLICTQKLLFNCKIEPTINIRPVLNDKIIPTTVVSSSGTKVTNVSFQNKSDENVTSIPAPIPNPINAQIIIGIKNPIQPCPSKISSTGQGLPQRPSSIYTNNSCNNIIANNSNTINTNATITPISQFQIISQNQNIKQIQLSPNFIFSPKIKCQTPFSPSKVIHIAPSISSISRTTPVKSEIVVPELISTNITADDKQKFTKDKKKKTVEPMKGKSSEIKLEASDEVNFKMSLFPMKYHWNGRRNHFIKKSDLKFKKSKSSSCNKLLNNLSGSEMQEDCNLLSCGNDLNNINWFIFKAFSQILMQKTYDEENLKEMCRLREKFEIALPLDDLKIPVFQKMCAKTQFYAPLPDQIDINCLSKYTDPHLFGISEDIIDNYVNSLTKNYSEFSEENFLNTESHECTTTCVLYSLEVAPSLLPKKFNKIIDLIEGIIVKEKNIIEKESEISNQFVKFIRHTSDLTPQNKKSHGKTNNHTDRFKWITECRR